GSDNNNIYEDINKLQLDNIKCMIKIYNQELAYEQVVLDKNKILANWFTTPTNTEKVINDKQKFLKKYKRKGFWYPLTFYCYRPSGVGKTKYLIDEFYTKIDWNEIINLLNDSCFEVEYKYATKPSEEAYNFRQYGREDDNKK
ncbi:32320_t:CDS:2, partial [Racocetra persica]